MFNNYTYIVMENHNNNNHKASLKWMFVCFLMIAETLFLEHYSLNLLLPVDRGGLGPKCGAGRSGPQQPTTRHITTTPTGVQINF